MTEHDNVDVAMARAGDPSPAQTEPEPALPRSAPSSHRGQRPRHMVFMCLKCTSVAHAPQRGRTKENKGTKYFFLCASRLRCMCDACAFKAHDVHVPGSLPTVSTPHGFYTFVPYSQVPLALAAATPGADIGPAPIVAGIPQGLAVMLRHTAPWSANVLYSVVPSGTLTPVDEVEPAPEWYVVYRGRFVGVMDQYMQAHWAIRSVSNAAHKTYATQAFALEAFNKVLSWGGVEVPGPHVSRRRFSPYPDIGSDL
ncbi:hypothetical protein C8F04DRAFT_1185037 [Mycena alexandri]|uniref:Uncharacterized protein n=1 Tax=Mycena alexandri TaxID=1745969 RepID=A0AAD6X517_9AGAR|nr:hypothetical protein C8F04DRAFT_1185037 [Mycena alexandri]